jgi:UDP-N-acetylmuramyl pentapeptide phosphotransferase/UDP-N-acetylglucosamine-1-phosphate transferase
MSALLILVAALLSAALIVAIRPMLARHALARPNARSSHATSTPQGAGLGVIAATFAVGGVGLFMQNGSGALGAFAPLALATVGLAAVGLLDDMRHVPASARLVAQALAVAVALTWMPGSARLLPETVPLGLERSLAFAGWLWFVNLVNFMDGIDWMTVAEVVPVTAALAGFSAMLGLSEVGVLAAALLGATLGFAPFNRPVARLFLGDAGSLPLGLLLGFLLYSLACSGAVAAAILLPLYYLADATLTLARRLASGEKIWLAHRSHYYQRATRNGRSVMEVVGHVFGLNLILAALALATLVWPGWPVALVALGIGGALVGLLLRRFAAARPLAELTA